MNEEESRLPPLTGKPFAEYFATYVAIANEELSKANQAYWLQWLRQENENINEALNWCLANPENHELGMALGATIWRYWSRQIYVGSQGEANLAALIAVLTSLLTANDNRGQRGTWARGSVLLGLGTLSLRAGLNKAHDYYTQSFEVAKQINDEQLQAEALLGLGHLALNQSSLDVSLSRFEQSLTIFERIGDQQGRCRAFKGIGTIKHRQLKNEEAKLNIDKSLKIAQQLGDDKVAADCFNEIGIIAYNQKNYFLSNKHFDDSVSILRKLGDKVGEAQVWNNISALDFEAELWEDGLVHALDAAAIYNEISDPKNEAYALINAAAHRIRMGNLAASCQDLKRSLHLIKTLGEVDRYGTLFAIEEFGRLSFWQGHYEQAVQLYGVGAHLRQSLGMEAEKKGSHDFEKTEACLKLGEEKFYQVWEMGKAIPLASVIDFTLSTC